MIVQHMLKWIDTARVAERAAAADALARAYVTSQLGFEERCAAEGLLTLLLDDPSPKVRLAIAEPLSLTDRAPLQVIHGLAMDQPEVAAPILALSPMLSDADLIERLGETVPANQRLIASRARVSMELSAAIAELCDAAACMELVANSGAAIASVSFRRMAERHGHAGELRDMLLRDERVPADTRHLLLVMLGEALRASPLVSALMSKQRADRLFHEACSKASLTLIDATDPEEHAALVEHLRIRGDLTTAFVARLVAYGKIDFFGAVLVALTGRPASRIRGILASGRDVAVAATLRAAGMPEASHVAVAAALGLWREVANGKRVAGAQEVSWLMMKSAEAGTDRSDKAAGELASLFRSIHLEALRDNARGHALAMAAA
ncbi:DUF2336 domain-containing protein [Mesorhizobium xinjiangense]|uniref:DUF2336 domain-containing protein n=1 Tax=Mesorhizobium xinjiangense TaxID=2678685 RepID=UPI0012EE4443|nr:DUF2336 domain-containing protein [Mesorhizobium xinjiangense]